MSRANDPRGTYAYCQTFEPLASIKLDKAGHSKVCHGGRCVGNGPENAFTLRMLAIQRRWRLPVAPS